MENNVNSKTTKTIRRKIGSVYAVPCINEETLTKWDQIFEVYFSEKPFGSMNITSYNIELYSFVFLTPGPEVNIIKPLFVVFFSNSTDFR